MTIMTKKAQRVRRKRNRTPPKEGWNSSVTRDKTLRKSRSVEKTASFVAAAKKPPGKPKAGQGIKEDEGKKQTLLDATQKVGRGLLGRGKKDSRERAEKKEGASEPSRLIWEFEKKGKLARGGVKGKHATGESAGERVVEKRDRKSGTRQKLGKKIEAVSKYTKRIRGV